MNARVAPTQVEGILQVPSSPDVFVSQGDKLPDSTVNAAELTGGAGGGDAVAFLQPDPQWAH